MAADAFHQTTVSGEREPDHQESWAGRHEIGRAPVRDAPSVRATENLTVRSQHGRRPVTEGEAVDKEELYRIRQYLEPEIARSIEWPTIEEIEKLRQLSSSSLRALLNYDLPEALRQGQRLYFSVYEHSPLEFMVEEVKRYWRLADEYRIAFLKIQLELDPGCRWFTSSQARMLQALSNHDREALVDHVLVGTTLPLQRLLHPAGI